MSGCETRGSSILSRFSRYQLLLHCHLDFLRDSPWGTQRYFRVTVFWVISFFQSAFLIFMEVNAFWKMSSISRKCSHLFVIWEEWIPCFPRAPPVTEKCFWEIVWIFIEKRTVVIIVIKIFLEGMYFPVHIWSGNNASFEHNEKG